ncbi:DEDD exonuclease domain-containing protein [Spongisporangium articulatum]|uniref:DEDD exonuclease domain-containing protein n=1 Tax=Spongisporangium articulatum TaxID=3362603 RepID=A0ABW8ASY5_9ACTN
MASSNAAVNAGQPLQLPLLELDESELLTVAGGRREAETPLHEVTFVVLDLETTGGAPADGGITEIGAVKVRGGELLGEFQTLVRPPSSIPPFIALLTGINDLMVAGAPSLDGVLPSLLEFLSGSVLVAHNAPYDVGFLKAACARTGHPWPKPTVLDTVRLARQVVTRDEAPNHKLSSLARVFGSPTTPDHRALTDARATVHVLHGLLERIGGLGVRTLGELHAYSAQVPERTRRKRHLADDVPSGPGVYLFHDERDRVLYVGTSVDLRTRVRSYFTAAEKRSRVREMLAIASRVTAVPCATALEGRVREIRLIAEHSPPYNRRSRNPERAPWVKLTAEAYPRLSVVRQVRADGGVYVGPFSSQGQAELAVAAVQEAVPIRRCAARLPRQASPGASACLLLELGRCGAPCIGGIDVEGYAAVAARAREALLRDAEPVVRAGLERANRMAGDQRYEEAALQRDRVLAYLRGTARGQRLAPVAAIPQLVGARRRAQGGWEFALVRYGRLAGASVSPAGADPMPYVEALKATGEMVLPAVAPMPATHPEETDLLLRWLEQPGVRLVELDGEWAVPAAGAARALARLTRYGLDA